MSLYKKHVTVAEKKAKAAKSLEKLRKKNKDMSPIVIEGRTIAKTWWGKEWCKNLESYADFTNSISRGKSYVSHGSILDLKIAEGIVTAIVQGSRAKPYDVVISIEPLKKEAWEQITELCEGKIHTLQDIILGKFPKELASLFTTHGTGLFPSPDEIDFNCSCPDWATVCKHVAAVLYGIGARLDENPALFFSLRKVNVDELISKAVEEQTNELLNKTGRKRKRVIKDSNISDVFGIDIE